MKIEYVDDSGIIQQLKQSFFGDAGLDLHSIEDVRIRPGKRVTVSTGVKIKIPEGYVGLLLDKSGLASKMGLTVLGGVIDSGYRGVIQTVLLNTGTEDIYIEQLDKVCQMVIIPHVSIEPTKVDNLDVSERGDKGFGSTGKK